MTNNNPFSHLDCNFVIRESKRAKRISLRIKPPNTVTLVIPDKSSIKTALRFAKEHDRWVEAKLKKAQLKVAEQEVPITSDSNFKTKFHQLKFIPHQSEKTFVRIDNQETRVYYPAQWEETDERLQDMLKIALRETYRKEAKAYLPTRLKGLAQKYGFSYAKVTIRDSKSRWGSCSAQKNISLSLSLMKLPYHLIDYILLHELCHTIEMNHGERFHQLLDKVSQGQSKALNKEVKQYSIR